MQGAADQILRKRHLVAVHAQRLDAGQGIARSLRDRFGIGVCALKTLDRCLDRPRYGGDAAQHHTQIFETT